MAKFKIHAGDFETSKGKGRISKENMLMPPQFNTWTPGETIPLSELETVEEASEESVKRIAGTVGWSIAGAVVLGPVGLLAGLLLGGKGKDVTFVARFKDGRKLLATTDSKTFTRMKAVVF